MGGGNERRSISPSYISRARYGGYKGGNKAAAAGTEYHRILAHKLWEGSINGVRRLPHAKEVSIVGDLGTDYVVSARLDNVLANKWGQADVVEGKLRDGYEDPDVAAAALTAFAIMGEGNFGPDIRFYYCYGYNFRLIEVSIAGMMQLKEPLITLAGATLAFLGYGEPGGKSRKKDELKGDFTFAFENLVRLALPYFG